MRCYLVGGAVRDQLLGYPSSERDWVVVGATPEQMTARGFRPVGRDFPVFLHPETQEEYALARTERKSGRGHQGFVFNADPSVTLEQDLIRRDLTINAMARSAEGELIDPWGGRRDLERRLLRHVSPAFVDDPLRVLRVARFASRYAHLGFVIAPETRQLMARIVASGELQHLSAERVWRELERALAEASPRVFLDVLADCGALAVWLPELASLRDPALERLGELTVPPGPHGVELAALRLALLACELEPEAVERLCQRLKAPRAVRDLARLASQAAPRLDQPLEAEALQQLLDRLDAWRRPERLQALVAVLAHHRPASPWPAGLQRCHQRCSTIDHRRWLEQGLTGAAIGQALHQARRQCIEDCLREA